MSAPPVVLSLLATLAAAALVACTPDELPTDDHCPQPCPCTLDGCPTGECGFVLTLGESCPEEEMAVELYVGGCLESVTLQPGEPVIACGTVSAGDNDRPVARSADIQWGPFDLTCPMEGGLLFPITLDCP